MAVGLSEEIQIKFKYTQYSSRSKNFKQIKRKYGSYIFTKEYINNSKHNDDEEEVNK